MGCAHRRRLEEQVPERQGLAGDAASRQRVLRPGVEPVGRAEPGRIEGNADVLHHGVRGHRHRRELERREREADDVPAPVGTPGEVGEQRRRVVVPAVLVPAHVLKPHRGAGELRENRRSLTGVEAGRAVPERARSLPVLDADPVGHKPEDERELVAHRVRVLRVAEDDRPRRGDVGDRAARADRDVGLVVEGVALPHGVRGDRDAASGSPTRTRARRSLTASSSVRIWEKRSPLPAIRPGPCDR